MDDTLLYEKYSHIIKGSIENVPRGKDIRIGKNEKIKSHGKICIIRCEEVDFSPHCQKTRLINIQDAGQVKKCKACVRKARNMRRRIKRGES